MGKTIKKIIIIVVIISFILIIGGVVLFLTTDIFKSKDALFQKYIAQNISMINYIFEFGNEKECINELMKNNYVENDKGHILYLENEEDEEEKYDIQSGKISDKEDKKSYRKTYIKYGDETISDLEFLSEDNIYGVKFANIVEQFVTIKNANLNYILSGLGLDAKYVDNSINNVKIDDLLDFSDEEKKTLANRYMNIIFSDISSKNYTSKKAIITLENGQSPETDSYTLTLTKNDFDNICKRVLNKLLEDDIILGKIKKIDQRLKEAGFVFEEENNMEGIYKSYINGLNKQFNYEGKNNSKISCTVYQIKDVTVRTRLKSDNYELLIDLNGANTTNQKLVVKIARYKNEHEENQIYSISKEKNEGTTKREIGYEDDSKELKLQTNIEKADKIIKQNSKLGYTSNSIKKIELDVNSEFEIGKKEDIPVKFKNKNQIFLNNCDTDKIVEYKNSLKDLIVNKLNESNGRINTKLLGNILVKIDENEKKKEEQLKNEEKMIIDRFNSQFEYFKGKDLESENIIQLLKVVKNHFDRYEMVGDDKVVIYIKENSKNDEAISKIAEKILDKEKSKYKYNVNMFYDERNILERIEISLVQKK